MASDCSRHMFLYGPPAAGKLTVATALAESCSLRVLDNHLSFDVALRLFEFGTTPFSALVEELRVLLIGTAAREGVDIVSTFVYAHPVDRRHVDRLVRASTDNGARVDFVQLLARRDVLDDRVTQASRAMTQKVRDREILRRIIDEYDLATPINDDDLSLDTSDVPAIDTARAIATQFRLGRSG